MASYHCAVKPISRSAGRSAVASAAYRAGIELVDQRTGQVHDYTRKSGVLSSEIIAPLGARIADHSALWNAVEVAEKRKDARTAREIIIALPDELTAGERRELATEYAEHLSDLYSVAVQLDLHAPDKQGDSRNWHAHLLLTTREVAFTADGPALGAKSTLEWSDTDRRKAKLGPASAEIERIREQWAVMQNAALERANRPERVDHRSFKAQGIDRIPQIKMGQAANALERKGIATDKGDYNRNIAEQNAVVVELADLRSKLVEQRSAELAQAKADQEIERTRALFAAKALAAQEAQAVAAAVVSREAVALGGFALEAMADHLIDYPADRAGLLAAYLAQPIDLTSAGSYTGQQRLKVAEYKAEQTALNRRGVLIKAEFEALQAELKAEQSRPAFARMFSSKTKDIEAKIDRNRSVWTKLKEAYEKLTSSIAYIVNRLSDSEKAETQSILQQRERDFEAAERAVPQRIEQRRIEAQEAPERARIESERRTNALGSLAHEHGPAATFAAFALAAIKEANGGEVDWPTVEDKALREMTKIGWPPERSLKVILEHSPDRTPLSPADLTLALQDAQRLEALKPKPEPKQDKPESTGFRLG